MAFIKKGIAKDIQEVTELIAAADGPTPVKLMTGGKPTNITGGSVALGLRDYAAEARGKTRCALEEAWAQSPLLPMLLKDPTDRESLHTLLDEIVTERMKRVFPNG